MSTHPARINQLLSVFGSRECFESRVAVLRPAHIDTQGVVRYPDADVQLQWEGWQKAIEHTKRLLEVLSADQAALLEDNIALACNLKGSKATTGATYTHLVRQRDGLAAELAQERFRSSQKVTG